MRSSSAGQAQSRSRLRAARRAEPGAALGADVVEPVERLGGRGGVAGRNQDPGLAVVDDGADARVVGRDAGSPQAIASIRTIPNDSGGSVVSTNRSRGAQHAGQLVVRDAVEEVDAIADARRRGLGAEAVEQLAAAGDEQVDVAGARPGERLDRDVEPLEVVGAIEGRDERGDDGVGGDAEPLAQAGRVGARARTSRCRRRSASRSPARACARAPARR